MRRSKKPALQRLLSKTQLGAHDCWQWTGRVGKNGYGLFWLDGTNVSAHRASWALHGRRPIGDLHVLHACDNRACVNPSHLFLGTPQDNMADMVAKGRAAGLRRRGEANPGAKLSVAKVAWIRAASNLGVPQRRIAKSVGVSQPTVSAVVTGARWA